MTEPGEITVLLQKADEGDRDAADALFRLVEQDLRAIAVNRRKAVQAADLSTTALIDDAFCQLVGQGKTQWEPGDRGKFYGFISRKMHDLLIDDVRRAASRRGAHEALSVEALPGNPQ